MRTRQLGNRVITAIGGGDLCLPTSAGRGVHARDVEHALHEAIAFGISLFDVASDADSEKLAGEAVRALRVRDRVVVATRVAVVAPRPGAPSRDVLPERLPARYIQDRIEATLRASRLEVLPLAQLPLHPAWLASNAWPELVGTCARLVDEGKVLAWGALLDEPGHEAAAALVAEPWLAALSVVYHVFDRRAEAVFPAVAQRRRAAVAEPPRAQDGGVPSGGADAPRAQGGGVPAARADAPGAIDQRARAQDGGVLAAGAEGREPAAARGTDLLILVRTPLAGGALAGTIGPGVGFPPRDDRNELGLDALEQMAVGAARLAALVKREPPAVRSCEAAAEAFEKAVRPEHLECDNVAELALRFAIDRAGVALPRLHRREHLLPGIAAAAASPLSAGLIARLLELTA
jgi:aryl-alcohol dehydrogenase-like predicted oxidoreductase